MNRRAIVAMLVVLGAAAGGRAQSPVRAAIDRLYAAIGTPAAFWSKAELDFTFTSEGGKRAPVPFAHCWDIRTGRYRLSWKKGDTSFVVLFNVNSDSGAAYLDGKEVADTGRRAKLLGYGNARFVNDTYWLLMPLKMDDPGVNAIREGGDSATDVIRLTFDKVGMTPGDTYWVSLDRASGLVRDWRYHLEGGGEGESVWEDWRDVGGVKLALSKPTTDRSHTVGFTHVSLLGVVDEKHFARP
jgi:hypothetical protein